MPRMPSTENPSPTDTTDTPSSTSGPISIPAVGTSVRAGNDTVLPAAAAPPSQVHFVATVAGDGVAIDVYDFSLATSLSVNA